MIEQYIFRDYKVRVFQQQKEGTACCGDSFYVKKTEEYLICGLADGLGSGEFAKESSQAAIDTLAAMESEPLETIMKKVNESQQFLRGVVMSLLKVDISSRTAYYCGMGNINLIITDEDNLYSQPIPPKGYISGRPLKFNVLALELPRNGWFALYSDGIHIQSNQIPYLYRVLESNKKDEIIKAINANSIRNRHDDATLIIGRFE